VSGADGYGDAHTNAHADWDAKPDFHTSAYASEATDSDIALGLRPGFSPHLLLGSDARYHAVRAHDRARNGNAYPCFGYELPTAEWPPDSRDCPYVVGSR
jgi:hypothetical protein